MTLRKPNGAKALFRHGHGHRLRIVIVLKQKCGFVFLNRLVVYKGAHASNKHRGVCMTARDFNRTLLKTAFSAAALLVQPITANAQAASQFQASAKYAFDLPAQPLEDALRSVGRQTGSNILFEPKTVSGRAAKAIKGQFTVDEVLLKIASEHDLELKRSDENTVVLRGVSNAKKTSYNAGKTNELPISTASNAQSLPRDASGAVASEQEFEQKSKLDPQQATSGSRAEKVERIEVTGSRFKRVESESALPVNVYTRKDIERSGQSSVGNFLSTLNEVSMITAETVAAPTLRQSTVQLRGLPVGSTLLLINGRRVQAVGSSSANLFNLNLIPLVAVERVEILPLGSSAVYGGDALAGVVNIILKKSADGSAIDFRYGTAKGTEDGGVSFVTGGGFERGSYVVLGSFNKTTPLSMGERSFFNDGDYRRFGGVDARTRNCTPGTVTSTTTANLPGLNSTFAAIPVNASGRNLTTADFASSSGQANLCNDFANGNGYGLTNGDEIRGIHVSADFRVSGSWSIFGELTYTDDRLRIADLGVALSNALVPANNPYNPFGVAVRVTSRLSPENGLNTFARKSEFARGVVGMRGEIFAGWDAEATIGTTQDRSRGVSYNTTTAATAAARTAALANTNAATALNPFTTGRAANEDVLNSIWPDTIRNAEGKKDSINAFVRGSAFSLPAGAVDLIAGAEWSRDVFKSASATARFDGKRTAEALFGEVRVPLSSSTSDSGRAFELATITLAGRSDKYSDFGNASTYQGGLEVRPVRSLLLRATSASSFKPPTLLQVNATTVRFTSEQLGLVDPRNGNAPIVGAEVVFGIALPLTPETGKAHSLGAIWEPEGLSGARLSLTAWRMKLDDLIYQPFPQDFLTYEAQFPGLIVRGPSVGGVPGPVTRVTSGFINIGRSDIAGTDLEGTYSRSISAGNLSLSASASRTSKYLVQIASGAPVENHLGRFTAATWAPKWKGRLSTGLDTGSWSVSLTGRYLGGYKDGGTSNRDLGDYWIFDVAANLNVKKLVPSISSAFKSTTLSFGIVNLGNKYPEYAGASALFYDFTQGDWRGRYSNIRISAAW